MSAPVSATSPNYVKDFFRTEVVWEGKPLARFGYCWRVKGRFSFEVLADIVKALENGLVVRITGDGRLVDLYYLTITVGLDDRVAEYPYDDFSRVLYDPTKRPIRWDPKKSSKKRRIASTND